MKTGTSKVSVSIITAVVTAVITATITVGIPEIVKAVKPAETINVVLQDLREKKPEEFDQYLETELQKSNRVIMDQPSARLKLYDQTIPYYTLGVEKYVSLSELIRASEGRLQISNDGILNMSGAVIEPNKNQSDDGSDWMEECPPYELGRFTIILESDGKEYNIGGAAYSQGLLSEPVWESQALFNLQGKYRTLTFSVGHVDGTDMSNCTYNFYIDDEKVKTITLKADQLITEYEIPLDYGQQLRIENMNTSSFVKYLFIDGIFK